MAEGIDMIAEKNQLHLTYMHGDSGFFELKELSS